MCSKGRQCSAAAKEVQMEWVERLNESMAYIEAHLTDEIDYGQLARIACCSTYHFQRMFTYMAGVTLAEYIRRRKMSLAAVDLQGGNARIIDIADKYGYQSPTAFNRAFQSIHGVAPSAVKGEGVSVVETMVCSTGIDNNGSAQQMMEQLCQKAGIARSDIRYTLATGYSRKVLTVADDDISEITAHAYGVRVTAPKEYRPGMIIDIGGQDSKIIYLDSGYNIKNFTMNDKCAAGTGKFMEVAAQILETTIDQVGPLSLESAAPCDINSTCVVFAQSEIISLIARQFDRKDILAGMHISMAKRIVKMMKKSEKNGDILMTGGGALNVGIRKAFEEELMKDVYVASHPQFNGAIGAALIASERA